VCSCRRGPGCDRPAKHPLVHHGLHDATCDPGQLQDWWQRWPLANVGLVTGVVFDALDIDGPAGLAALGELQQAAGLRLPVRWWPRGAVAGTTGSARPGWATAHPAASPTSTGAAAAAACYDLRHTAVALWIAAGANPKEIAARAGHASVSFTLGRYGHLYPEADLTLRERLQAIYASSDSSWRPAAPARPQVTPVDRNRHPSH
jgi:hypothetical protein